MTGRLLHCIFLSWDFNNKIVNNTGLLGFHCLVNCRLEGFVLINILAKRQNRPGKYAANSSKLSNGSSFKVWGGGSLKVANARTMRRSPLTRLSQKHGLSAHNGRWSSAAGALLAGRTFRWRVNGGPLAASRWPCATLAFCGAALLGPFAFCPDFNGAYLRQRTDGSRASEWCQRAA